MSNQSWTVVVDGTQRNITVDVDGESGRASIRVDGKMAARPLPASEDECEVRVGSMIYLLRRMPDGSFDLDLAPPDEAAIALRRQTLNGAPLPKPPKRGVQRFIAPLILFTIAAGLAWWAWESSTYVRVPWQTWSGHGITIDFPGSPDDNTETKLEEGKRVQYPAFEATYHDHVYALESVEMDEPLGESSAYLDLRDVVQDMFKGSATLDELIYREIRGHRQVRFTAHLPADGDKPAITANGIATSHLRQVYVVWVETPPDEADAADVAHYLISMKLPDEYAYRGNSGPSLRERVEAMRNRSAAGKAEREEARATMRLTGLWVRIAITVTVLFVGMFALRSSMS